MARVREAESQMSAQTSTENFMSCGQGQHSQTVSAALTGQPDKTVATPPIWRAIGQQQMC